MVYYYHDLILFLFIDKKFNVVNQLPKVKKISKWVDKFFRDFLNVLNKVLKNIIIDNHLFCYTNNANRSIRLSGFIKKNQLDEKLFETLKKALFNNENNNMSGLTKFKGYYIYYIKSMTRKIIILFKDNLNMLQLNDAIHKVVEDNFYYIFLD